VTPPRTYEEACEQADARAAHVAALHSAHVAYEADRLRLWSALARGECSVPTPVRRVVVCGHCGGDGCERCHGVGEVAAVRDEGDAVRRVA